MSMYSEGENEFIRKNAGRRLQMNTVELLEKCGFDRVDFDIPELMLIHHDLIEAVSNDGSIVLDMSYASLNCEGLHMIMTMAGLMLQKYRKLLRIHLNLIENIIKVQKEGCLL